MEPYLAPGLTDKVNSILWSIGSEPRAILAGAVLLEKPRFNEDVCDSYYAWSGERGSHSIRRNITDCLEPLGVAKQTEDHDAMLTKAGLKYAKPIAISALYFVAETDISISEVFPKYIRSQRHVPRARNTAEILIQLSHKFRKTDELIPVIEVRRPSATDKEDLLFYELNRLKKSRLVFYADDDVFLTQGGIKAANLMQKFADALQDKPVLDEMQARAFELTAEVTTKAMQVYRKKSSYKR